MSLLVNIFDTSLHSEGSFVDVNSREIDFVVSIWFSEVDSGGGSRKDSGGGVNVDHAVGNVFELELAGHDFFLVLDEEVCRGDVKGVNAL